MFLKIYSDSWMEATQATLLETDLDFLQPFKLNWIRLGTA